ncbi:YigZ family protein [Defluviitalea phaphyphila]|uniref:YigZ family protein n=1 Tax=Defluviitalea phaphyphila TaxID=1473580 RepID=UPI000730DF77|nr:YigZ family protein [Defluviitalea phaphyphila]
MLKRFKTVLNLAQAEIIEKKSRFIATVKPVKDEKEAQAFIEEIKKKYWDATHNVFAYQVGERNQIQRFSDDGEPSGTAGLPVLDVLKGEDIKNTAIVVTRYFGGTLLGTGGLVRAYGRCAKEGVLKAKIIEKILYRVYHVITDYSKLGKIQYEILQMGHVIQDTLYTDKITFIVLVEDGYEDSFIKKVTEISSAQVEIKQIKYIYGTWLEDKLSIEEINK